MSNLVKKEFPDVAAVEQALVRGDLGQLSQEARLSYMKNLCESLGLNHLSRPFEYITLNGRLTLYARKDATDQLRRLYNVSIKITYRGADKDIYTVSAMATLPDGRTDESQGSVSVAGLKGDALANATMKAETKAKRRATLSICGLGFLDETEIHSVPHAQRVDVTPTKLEPITGFADTPLPFEEKGNSKTRANAVLKSVAGLNTPSISMPLDVIEPEKIFELADYEFGAGRFKGYTLGTIPEQDLKEYLKVLDAATGATSAEYAAKIREFLKLQGE